MIIIWCSVTVIITLHNAGAILIFPFTPARRRRIGRLWGCCFLFLVSVGHTIFIIFVSTVTMGWKLSKVQRVIYVGFMTFHDDVRIGRNTGERPRYCSMREDYDVEFLERSQCIAIHPSDRGISDGRVRIGEYVGYRGTASERGVILGGKLVHSVQILRDVDMLRFDSGRHVTLNVNVVMDHGDLGLSEKRTAFHDIITSDLGDVPRILPVIPREVTPRSFAISGFSCRDRVLKPDGIPEGTVVRVQHPRVAVGDFRDLPVFKHHNPNLPFAASAQAIRKVDIETGDGDGVAMAMHANQPVACVGYRIEWIGGPIFHK